MLSFGVPNLLPILMKQLGQKSNTQVRILGVFAWTKPRAFFMTVLLRLVIVAFRCKVSAAIVQMRFALDGF